MKVLGPEDIRKLGKYLQHPLGKKSKRCIALFEYLKKRLRYTDKSPSYEQLFAKVYPDMPTFKKARIVETISDLSKLIDEFFMVEELFLDPELQLLLKARAEKKRSLNRNYLRDIEKLARLNEQNPIRDEHFYQKSRFYNQQLYLSPNTNIFKRSSAYYLSLIHI